MMGPETLACSEGEERFLNLWKPPHQWRVQLEQKGTSGAQRRVVCGRRVWDLCRWFVLQPCMPQPEMGVHWWSWKLCTATWGLESTWEGTILGCEETVWGNGSEKFCNWECLWRKLRPSEKKSTIVEWCIKDRATILASLLPRHLLPPLALRRAPAGAGLHTPSCCLLSLPFPQPGWHAHPVHHLMSTCVSIPTSTPSLPGQSVCLNCHFSSFQPDRSVGSGNLRSRFWCEEHMQR